MGIIPVYVDVKLRRLHIDYKDKGWASSQICKGSFEALMLTEMTGLFQLI